MNLLIISTLPKEDAAAQRAIRSLVARPGRHKLVNSLDLDIRPCIGCNACWLKTPGRCSIHDDYQRILPDYLRYDGVVYVSGTALGFVHSPMKNIVDRILPLATMYTCIVDGQMRHVPRYDKTFRFGLLYAGEADPAYLNRWLDRVALNMLGESMGAYPIDQAEEAFPCISL